MLSTLTSCAAFLALVAMVSWRLTRGRIHSNESFFLAGRSLTAPVIAGSLLLTNISTEQLVGLAGSAYAFNMSSMAWEVTAGLACIVMALFLLPRYLRGGFSTLPQFLESRFDARVRRASALLFVLGYMFITLPSVLYSGSVAVLALTDLSAVTGLDHATALLVTMLLVALIGGAFAVTGGLRAIAISDTLFGVGLLVMGMLVPILGLRLLGDGSVLAGVDVLASNHTEKLNAIGRATDPTPFATLFTGMLLANLFYWGTNQYVIQRALGATSLEAGQKGVLISGFFKVLVPFMVMVPGIIAFHLYGPNLPTMDAAYPTLARAVLPVALQGVFLAVVIGVVVSSFNSLVNSAATLIAVDLSGTVRNTEKVRAARWQSVVIVAIALGIAMQLTNAPDGLWQLIRKFTGFYNIPIITLVLAAIFIPRVNPLAALIAMAVHVLIYGLVTFVFDTGIHFIHWYAILFLLELLILVSMPRVESRPMESEAPAPVDLTPWRYRHLAAGLLLASILATYVLFSPLGVAT